MKKQLLTLLSVLTVGAAVAQTPSPSLNINQNATYALPSNSAQIVPGVRFIDAIDQNVVWTIGYDAAAPNRNYNWWAKTTNGGSSFSAGNVYADTNTYRMSNMEGIDANTAWVSAFLKSTQSQGAIHRTINGGTSWQNMTAAGMYTNAAAFTNIVSFFTPSIGITMGDPVNNEFEIWRTTNGGLSWSPVPGANIPNPLSAGEYGIVDLYYRLGSNNLWFGTNQGRIFRTTDAGLTWNASLVGVNTNTIIEIAFSSANDGLVSLINTSQNWELWNTTDGGATWTQIPTIDPNFGFNDMCGVPGTNMLISVGNQNQIVSSSIDNGVTWTDWLSTGIGYVTLDFVDGTTGWVGTYQTNTSGNLWKYSGSAISGTTAPTAAFLIPASACLSGGSAVVTVTNNATGNPAPTFSWSVSPAATISNPTANAPTITFNTANSYTVTLTASNSGGTVTSQQIIDVSACQAPSATFTLPAAACTNFTFAASNTSTGSPSPANFWSISPAANTTITPSAIANTPSFKVGAAGVYTITLVTSNASGTATSSQTVSLGTCPPNASFTIPNAIAFCDVKTFTTVNQTQNPPGTSGSITYVWTVSPNVGLSYFPNRFQPNMVVTVSDPTILSYTVNVAATNASGTSTATAVILVDDCTSITENSLNSALDVYPNPARDNVNVVLPAGETYQVKVTNLLGKVVYSETVNKEKTTINLSSAARGVYFITVESKTEKVTRKVVLD